MTSKAPSKVVIHTDGSFDSASQSGGWAFVIDSPSGMAQQHGAVPKEIAKSSSACEAYAVLKALIEVTKAKHAVPTLILCDNKFLVNAVNTRKLPRYRPRNASYSLLMIGVLTQVKNMPHVSFKWIPRKLNQRADHLSKRGRGVLLFTQ